ncbi:MAG TPA: hypothetical protein VFE25_05860 [Opitutaceae bacterium]|nr:hypothetical protein [Opitutaceae bacterium]
MALTPGLRSQAADAAKPDATPIFQSTGFDEVSEKALQAMRAHAEALHMSGVAIVAFSAGDTLDSWSSRMVVVGSMLELPSATRAKGSNLLGVAYAKAAEMAATLKDSGKLERPVMTGEFGWQGGVVTKGKSGVLIAAFSGGRSEDDVSTAKAGLAVLSASL